MTTNAATRTTRFLITRTARLRALVRQFDFYSVAAGAALAIILIVGLRITPATAPQAAPTAAATAVLRSAADGTHQATRRLDRVPAAVRQLPTAQPQPTAAPALAPVAAPVEPQQLHLDTAPQPAPTAAAGWTADPQIQQTGSGSVSTFEPPADAPRLCTGFGDWRDYDANYASSPACQPVQH